MNEAQEIILDHYHSPRNFGKPTWTPSGSARVQNLSCGDEIEVFVEVVDGKITRVAFAGEGCSIAVASASMLLEEVVNTAIGDIEKMDVNSMQKLINIKLTTSRIKCSALPLEVLKLALEMSR